MGKPTDPSRDRLERLLRVARGSGRAVIAVQDHPDPDGIASAAALKRLLQEKAGVEATLAAAGEIRRAENRAALQFLGETFEDTASLDLQAFDLRVLVDAQPGFGNNSWPDDVPVHVVIDHHPRGPGIQPDQLADIRPDYGATATILVEYLRAAGLEPDAQLATALLYGIKTDTQDLSRGAAPADIEAFLYLYPRANHRLLAKIERERLPRQYFALLARALADCRVYDNVAVCSLGPIDSPECLSEIADLLLRAEGVQWVLCHGLVGPKLHLSVRTVERQGRAGQLTADLLDPLGSGGGHHMLAGGQVPLPADADGDGQDDPVGATVREVELRFLRATRVPTRTAEPLIPTAAAASEGQGPEPEDSPYRVDFPRMPWAAPTPGARSKERHEDGRRVRLLELTPELRETQWCTKAHIGFVLEGQLEIDFDGTVVVFGPGDALVIPAGEDHRHKATVRTQTARLFLVEDG